LWEPGSPRTNPGIQTLTSTTDRKVFDNAPAGAAGKHCPLTNHHHCGAGARAGGFPLSYGGRVKNHTGDTDEVGRFTRRPKMCGKWVFVARNAAIALGFRMNGQNLPEGDAT